MRGLKELRLECNIPILSTKLVKIYVLYACDSPFKNRDREVLPPRPPNRVCGSPAHDSPVSRQNLVHTENANIFFQRMIVLSP